MAISLTSLGCGSKATPEPATKATITATPNPVPAGPGAGATTIDWDTGDGTPGAVFFSVNGGPEKQWFTKRPTGSQEINWINKGGRYEFRLYADTKREQPLATVTVTKE